jgi:VanZ family protein
MELLHRLAKPLFWAALILAYVIAIMPAAEAPQIVTSDKLEHMIAFATLAVLARLGYRTVPAIRIALLLAIFGALIEFTQMIPALHRDGDVRDWIADVIALSVALFLVHLAMQASARRRGAA